jgi:hypothetical protein
MKKIVSSLCGVVVLGAFLGACDKEDPEAIQERVALQPFTGCDELEVYIKDQAVRHMASTINASIKYYSTRDSVNMPSYKDAGAYASSADAGTSGSTDTKEEGPTATTTTNTQVKDVDEPDFMKNDGTRIFVLSGKTLYITKSWPASSMSLVGSLDLEGYPQNMFLDKNRLVVLSTVTVSSGAAVGECIGSYGCGSAYGNVLKVTVIDVADGASPKIKSEFFFPGSYAAARRVGSSVRLVLTDTFNFPAGVQWYPTVTSDMYSDNERMVAALEELKDSNERLIRAQPLSAWLGGGKVKTAGGGQVDLAYVCTDFYRPNASVELGMASVVTINLDQVEDQPARMTILGSPDTVFASKDSLYLTANHHWWTSDSGHRGYTYLHKIDITDPSTATYVASGGLEGHFLNQFSLDEYKGYLRVATTRTIAATAQEKNSSWSSSTTVTNVSVLSENAGRLEVIGLSDDLGRGEYVYSVRFMSDRGYVVTYRQIDPLFTLDLSDPTAPRVVGELKVPGYSTYLQVIDTNHVLSMGVNSDWRIKLTLFDVTDFANPKELSTILVGSWGTSSEAAGDYKAFNYFSARKLLAVPFADYSSSWDESSYWTSFKSDLRVYSIDTTKGISEVGALGLSDLFEDYGNKSWGWGYSPWIRRSVMSVDSKGVEYAYAISDVGIRVAAVSDLSTPISTVKFR